MPQVYQVYQIMITTETKRIQTILIQQHIRSRHIIKCDTIFSQVLLCSFQIPGKCKTSKTKASTWHSTKRRENKVKRNSNLLLHITCKNHTTHPQQTLLTSIYFPLLNFISNQTEYASYTVERRGDKRAEQFIVRPQV